MINCVILEVKSCQKKKGGGKMSRTKITPAEVDEVRVSIIVDNSFDMLMASSDIVKRFPLGPNPFEDSLPIAEHGFSALIKVKRGNNQGTVLFDTGVSRTGILHNMDAMEINISDIQAIILSHGHADHANGLAGIVNRKGARNLPLVLHPDVYLERKVTLASGNEIRLPAPRIADLRQENVEIIQDTKPSMLVDNMVLVSGEIPRTTEFEKGLPTHFAKRNDSWEHDPFILDDQCAIANVRDKGLVIVTGCGHSGVINVIRNAQTLTGITKVYAVIGGFHLTGGLFEKIIPNTIDALREINPRYIMPGHCTGWSAIHQIARALPEAFIPGSVGTTLIL
jgi:7,8-dihydropterin-6-yl-methyl-4-(beta-D-ribofuranosyl)aminobenzene 5'-phosphate synthase